MKASEFSFKKGLNQLNPQPNFNFQLNRVIMWDGGRLEEFLCVYLYTEKSPAFRYTDTRKGEIRL